MHAMRQHSAELHATSSCGHDSINGLGSFDVAAVHSLCSLFADDIYRDDITFRDPRNAFSGLKNYKLIFWSLRFHGRIFFTKLYVEVRRIWQPQDGLICMRWTVHGIPRVPWEAEGTFDGISQYKLDSDGKIYEHAGGHCRVQAYECEE